MGEFAFPWPTCGSMLATTITNGSWGCDGVYGSSRNPSVSVWSLVNQAWHSDWRRRHGIAGIGSTAATISGHLFRVRLVG